MKVIIAGPRTFNNEALFKEKCDYFFSQVDKTDLTIISGHAPGTDEMGEKYAYENGIDLEIHPANWKKYGKSAGPRRNRRMAQRADALLSFWDGQSKGTENMIKESRQLGLIIKIVMY